MHLCINVKHAIQLNNTSKFGSYLTVDTKRLHYRHEPVNAIYRNNHSTNTQTNTYCLLVAFFETPHDNAHAFSFPSHLGVKTREKTVYKLHAIPSLQLQWNFLPALVTFRDLLRGEQQTLFSYFAESIQ